MGDPQRREPDERDLVREALTEVTSEPLDRTGVFMSQRNCISMISRRKIAMHAEKTYGEADVFTGAVRVG